MTQGQTVFAQLIQHLSHKEFHRCVDRYHGDHRIRSFTCWEQFLAMAFAQLTFRESLRDIEDSLGAVPKKLRELQAARSALCCRCMCYSFASQYSLIYWTYNWYN